MMCSTFKTRKPDALLEMLMRVAVSNAAGRAPANHCFVSFIEEFGAEMGVRTSAKHFARDRILSKIRVPKFIFPGQTRLLSQNRYLGSLEGILGTAELQRNNEGFDLLVQAINSNPSDSVRFKEKDQGEIVTDDLVDPTRQLMRGGTNVGVLVLRRCSSYWGDEKLNIKNRTTLQEGLKLIPKLGKAYLISDSGKVETLIIKKKVAASGRLILFQVSESSFQTLGAT
jgi:hypothetical protein